MQNILFITWDGPQTNYMEGLFMPILSEVQKSANYRIHIIQFTWGTQERIAITQKKAAALDVIYTAKTISRKPVAVLGSLLTLYSGIKFLKKYINNNKIDIVMPRSTMPSIMVNRLKKTNFKILFDADGLPLEERVDFSGLLRTSRQYRFFKMEETKMLQQADGVITRSQKAIDIHLETIHHKRPERFSVVFNGRNIDFFKPKGSMKSQIQAELNIQQNAKLFVYCGSLGPQYGWDEMIVIFQKYQQKYSDAFFLILTGNMEFAKQRIPAELSKNIMIKKVPFEEVPKYLSAADIAFAIREPKFSMQGVAPIKLGEYLLMGIPTIASAGIGDSEELIKQVPNTFLFYHDKPNAIDEALRFVENLSEINHQKIREFGINFFSVEKSAESYIQSFNKLSNICNCI
ncbi:glycosyltransferase [Flavobacterium sp.]|uniref:glycosyltransferase n=1 Tax=Flavobacterium sp. TaxID=239 RepID=UPI0025D8461D|nr:glycosyltransferase [Flavobacterium sp.]